MPLLDFMLPVVFYRVKIVFSVSCHHQLFGPHICCIFATLAIDYTVKEGVVSMHHTIGDRIKARREQLGLSGEYVAKLLGKDKSTYYRYERGEIENLPYVVLRPLAKILGVSEAWLLTGQEEIAVKRIPYGVG